MTTNTLLDAGNFRYIDTETTGLSYENDRIISLGIVTVENHQIVNEKEWFFNPGEVRSSSEAKAVHGISESFLATQPTFKQSLPEILPFFHEAIIGAHNKEFDLKFLDAECKRHRFPTVTSFMSNSFCSMLMSREKWPGKKSNLDAILDRCGIDRRSRVKHGALLDARLGAMATLHMRHRQITMLDGFENHSETVSSTPLDTTIAPIIIKRLDEAEIAAHAAYLEGLSAENKTPCIWTQLNKESNEAIDQSTDTDTDTDTDHQESSATEERNNTLIVPQ